MLCTNQLLTLSSRTQLAPGRVRGDLSCPVDQRLSLPNLATPKQNDNCVHERASKDINDQCSQACWCWIGVNWYEDLRFAGCPNFGLVAGKAALAPSVVGTLQVEVAKGAASILSLHRILRCKDFMKVSILSSSFISSRMFGHWSCI